MMIAGGADAPAPPGSSSSGWRPYALIGAIALLVMLPELIGGPSYTFSFRYNFIWAGEFSRLFLEGNLWPRWLPGLSDGLGSPSFYFYPPLYFWMVSLVRAASFGLLQVPLATSIATLLILGASGIAMRAWLRSFASDKAALIGAIAYMLAPYHIDDIYTRGALAEVTAYAVLPLTMLALRQVTEGPCLRAMAGLALAYAMLMLCHLPLALLASVTLLPMAMLWQAWRGGDPIPVLARCAGSVILGVCLSAAYWWPALALRPYISWSAMSGEFFRVDRWFFWSANAWMVSFQIFLTLATCLFAVAVLFQRRQGDVRLWVALILLCALLISGALPFVWELPGLREVQFAWRLLAVVEFATITLLVMAPPRLTHPVTLAAVMAMAGAVGIMLVSMMSRIDSGWRYGDIGRKAALSNGADAPEYLPAGFPIKFDDMGRADPGQFTPPDVPLASASGGAVLRSGELPDGAVLVQIRSRVPVRVTVRRFAFPGWVATSGSLRLPTGPEGAGRLVSWTSPAGLHEYRVHRIANGPERVGWFISAAAFLVFALLLFLGRARDMLRVNRYIGTP